MLVSTQSRQKSCMPPQTQTASIALAAAGRVATPLAVPAVSLVRKPIQNRKDTFSLRLERQFVNLVEAGRLAVGVG
ncbi:MAG: hypothetical protein KDD91_14365, partial [Caldilinea sp.]|nr:hypothetical protein [Caldilinea sp.]